MKPSLPFYAKTALILLMLWLLLYGIYLGQSILLPLGFSFLFAVLLRPLDKKLESWRMHRVVAILLSLLIAIIVLAGLLLLISTQAASLVRDIPAMKENLIKLWRNCQSFLDHSFHLNLQQQQQMLDKAKKDTLDDMGNVLTRALGTLGSSIADLLLVPVYVFLFLYYRELLIRFITCTFERKHSEKVAEIIHEIRSVVQHYVTGIMTETAFVAILNCLGLIVLGVPFALLLGIIGAILNLIPYIGGVLAVILTAIIAYTNTGEVSKLIGVLIIHMIVQFIDNHFFVPYLIGSKVKLNALISLLIVFIGGALCGVGGMFLSIPAIAICKVIFDRIDNLKPWGMLLGDDTEQWVPIPMPGIRAGRRRKKVSA
jgi:predicted PurR-regulated permease PerM